MSGTQIFTYTLPAVPADSFLGASITVVASDTLTNDTGNGLGYNIQSISGTWSGQTITGMAGSGGAHNSNNGYGGDNTIFDSNDSGLGGASFYGIDGDGIAFYVGGNTVNLSNGGTKYWANVGPTDNVGGSISFLTTPTSDAPCFCTGTRIATDRGDLLVEELRVNDLVKTPANGFKTVSWIGYRGVDCRRHPAPEKVWPVRVAAGAFGAGLPHRDLWLSPDHAVFINGVLIPVRYLINDATIVVVPVDTVTYWHVELARHDILLAEGLPCESYLDTGNRGAFTNGADPTRLHPDFALRVWEAEACARLVPDGPERVAAHGFLLEQAGRLGYALTTDPALRLHVDGDELLPAVCGQTCIFHLPETANAVTLVSRCSVPAHIWGDVGDHRRLGVAVSGLRLDGAVVPLTDTRLGSGWHDVEPGWPDTGWRWTDGKAALLLSGGQKLEIDLAVTHRYWVRAEAAAQARAA